MEKNNSANGVVLCPRTSLVMNKDVCRKVRELKGNIWPCNSCSAAKVALLEEGYKEMAAENRKSAAEIENMTPAEQQAWVNRLDNLSKPGRHQ